MNKPEAMTIDCGEHGERVATVVCGHLLNGEPAPAGFIENSDDPKDLQAWCAACERLFLQEGALTDAFRKFNRMSIVCCQCYANAKVRHSTR